MPNWTDNTLIIIVPAAQRDAFLQAISGPEDWPMPLEAFRKHERPKIDISNHIRMDLARIGQENHETITEFKQYMAQFGWPDWMKPSRTDLEVFLVDRSKLCNDIVPFSVARLAPWVDQAEFDRFFPNADPDGMLWISVANKNNSPIIELRHHKIGPKWTPGHIEIDVIDEADHAHITITYQTPWSPIENIVNLMEPVCRKHRAKFLMTWVEEQGYCGYTYLDPASGDPAQDYAWDIENPFMKEDFGDEGDTWMTFDRVDFETTVSGIINDPDF